MQFAAIFPIVVLDEDEPIHTDDEPYCGDNTCPCVVQAVIDGLLTIDEALRIELGEQL
jgi:hypothetical protein